MRRLLRLGLGLAAGNRGALVLPAAADRGALEAMARGDLAALGPPEVRVVSALDGTDLRRDALRAVQDLVQWRNLSRAILGEPEPAADDGPPAAPARRTTDAERGFFIFQP